MSVLFADLVGFTPFAEERDAEDVRDTLGRYFDQASDVIRRYGGTVEKFIGDAVMAVWGAPVAREDDAERAVRAALELVDAVQSLGPGIQARAGVLTGEAAVTVGALNQGLVAGDIVNTAARLQSAAPPGSVLVGEATRRAASAAIVFEAAGDQALKGKAAPVPAWRAIRVVAGTGGRNRAETLEAPFVGRDDELRLLKDLYHATDREHRARLVSVIGPAGIGKSRLAWEFLKYVDGLADAVWWHQGRSPAYGEGISFWALGEMIRGRCGLLETDDESTTRAKVAETLERHVPDAADRDWIEPALLSLLGFGSGVRSGELFSAWRTFFERLAATAPVALVFEDFHFADPGLLDFVEHLMTWSRTSPIYVLTLARPELLDRRPTWGAGERSFASVHLDPLPEPAMRELLRGLVPGLPEPAARAIVARADGVPLYAVETIRMLLADGRLELRGDAYVPVGELGQLAVPETLTALIASRLDGLAPDDRALVSDAAVLGQSFTVAALAAVSGLPEADLVERLRALVRRELLTLDVDPRSPERGQYAFVQALIREVAYNTLSRKDRRARHLAAARFFETQDTDELAAALAGHYLAAHATAPEGPEADALAAQARIALEAAAGRAASLGSHDQAATFLEQALTVTTDPAERARLLERAGSEASIAGQVSRAEGLLRPAVELHREAGDRRALARAIATLGTELALGRRLDEALALLEPASEEFRDLFPDPGVVLLDSQLARSLFLHSDVERALEVCERVLPVAERESLLETLADTFVTKGSLLGSLGRLREGVGLIEIGERLAEANGYSRIHMRAINNRISFLFVIDPRAASTAVDEALELALRYGIRVAVQGMLTSKAQNLALMAGDTDAALETLAVLEDDPSDAGDRLGGLYLIAWIHALRGEDVHARVTAIEAATESVTDPRFAVGGEWPWFAFFERRFADASTGFAAVTTTDEPSFDLVWAARSALWARDVASAHGYVAAIDATGTRAPLVDVRRATVVAGIAAASGDVEAALALYREALPTWSALGQAFDEAMTALDMAVLLGPGVPAVRAAADRARAFFERMQAPVLVEMLDDALARPGGGGAGANEPSAAGAVTSS